jgi:hypothetical protein
MRNRMSGRPVMAPRGKGALGIHIPQQGEDGQGRSAADVIALLVVFRIINALCVSTFFQPDEYFQALEPAWQIAFGRQSGAWITWVRRVHCCPSPSRVLKIV